jgi:hypothetical protein
MASIGLWSDRSGPTRILAANGPRFRVDTYSNTTILSPNKRILNQAEDIFPAGFFPLFPDPPQLPKSIQRAKRKEERNASNEDKNSLR